MFSIASILTMAACIFLVGVFYSLVTNVDNIAQKVEQEVPVTVFLMRARLKNRCRKSVI